MDPEIQRTLDRIRELVEARSTFHAYHEARRLLGLLRQSFPAPIIRDDHYANPELALRLENTFPGWRMEVPPRDPAAPPTLAPLLRIANPFSVTDDQVLVFAHDLGAAFGNEASHLARQHQREMLRVAGRSLLSNLAPITDERFLQVNERLVYWGEAFLAARSQQCVGVALFNEVSGSTVHVLLICGADHFNLTRTLLETFLDRLCCERIELLPRSPE